jgi:hypothetical protein
MNGTFFVALARFSSDSKLTSSLEHVMHFFPAASELFGLIEAPLPDSVPL